VLLIDAYNVLHATAALGPDYAGMGVRALVDLLGESRWMNDRVRVICDGTQNVELPTPPDDIRVIYAGPGKDADSLIERMVDESTGPRDLTVVTNDNRIRKYARRRRARLLGSERFLKLLVQKPRKAPPSNAKPAVRDPEHWLDVFDLDESEIAKMERSVGSPACGARRKPEARDDEPGDAPSEIPDSDAAGPPRRAGETETEYWLRVFGFGDERSQRD